MSSDLEPEFDAGAQAQGGPEPSSSQAGSSQAGSSQEGTLELGSPFVLQAQGPEVVFENRLRPTSFEQFVGQERVVDNLGIALRAARARDEPPDHMLLSGPPGLGKTSLARIVAKQLGTNLSTTTGPALQLARDLVGILTNLKRGDVLFIDEIHRVPPAVEEYLYTAMEDFAIDLTIEQGPHARIIPLNLEPFVLIGATTREGLLSAAFRGRFGHLERLEPYPVEELSRIVQRSAKILDLELTSEAATMIAERSRGTPRVANRFLRRVRDLAQVEGAERADGKLALDALRRLGVDARGLEDMDRKILDILVKNGANPVGLKTLAAATGESEDTLEDVFEPHLLRQGLIHKTSRGRIVTPRGRQAMGLDPGEAEGDTERSLFDGTHSDTRQSGPPE